MIEQITVDIIELFIGFCIAAAVGALGMWAYIKIRNSMMGK